MLRRTAITMLLLAMPAWSAEYCVAPTGDNAWPGTRAKPFRTIQKAADVMQPGDTCTVRGGTYREAVRPKRSGAEGTPIRFIAAKGERVVLDGTEPVTGEWTRHKGSIFKARLAEPTEQLFVDGKMQIEARWPNMRFEQIWDRSKWAKSNHGSRKDLMVCKKLAETGIDWTGAVATLNVGHQYKTWARTVTKHSKGSKRFTYFMNERLGDGKDDGPTWADDRFFITGKLEALDAATEWYHDADAGVLYLWTDDGKSPAGRRLEYKKRVYAFDASKVNHIEVRGFRFFAATFRFNGCDHCVVDDCRLLFPTYARRFEERKPNGKPAAQPASTFVFGSHNVVRRTSLALSNVFGLYVRGQHNLVENCIVHDVNWVGNISYAGISIRGASKEANHNVVRRCTLYGVGNIGILYSGPEATIEYNHVYGTGRTCRDIAAIHTGGSRARGSITHHNWVHDSTGLGMRGDDQTRGLTFHHNVIWSCRRGFAMKGNENYVYNNTVLVDPKAKHSIGSIVIPKRPEPKKWWTRNPTLAVQNVDTIVCNNAAFLVGDRGSNPLAQTDKVSHNVMLSADLSAIFVDASAAAMSRCTFDLRPKPGSPLIDAGRRVPGVELGYKGRSPDAGAYESGEERWRAGADWRDEPIEPELVVKLEAPGRHSSVPLPQRLPKAGISEDGLAALHELYDKLWAKGGRVDTRRRAIGRREQHKKGSAEWKKHHAVVAKLHRDMWMELRDKGLEVLAGDDVAAFKKAMGIK